MPPLASVSLVRLHCPHSKGTHGLPCESVKVCALPRGAWLRAAPGAVGRGRGRGRSVGERLVAARRCSKVGVASEAEDIVFFFGWSLRPCCGGLRKVVPFGWLPHLVAWHLLRCLSLAAGKPGCAGSCGWLLRLAILDGEHRPGPWGSMSIPAPVWAQAPQALWAGRARPCNGLLCKSWVHLRLQALERW